MNYHSHYPKNGWFENVASEYQICRPTYPKSFFLWMSKKVKNKDFCWDVGCGNGQASLGLTKHFKHIHASDISPNQISKAPKHPRITYQVANAHSSGLPSESINVINVAAAVHWFDIHLFNSEALRVIRPGGLMVWVGYDPIKGAPSDIQKWLD